MYFKQITVEGMGCLSYVIGCPQARVACVVDPKRDVQDYIDIARANGMKSPTFLKPMFTPIT